MSPKKATRKGEIPAKNLKKSINAYLSELALLISNCLKKRVFPDDPKLADVTPKQRKLSICWHTASFVKVLIIYKQIDNFMENKLPYPCGFRKN